MLYLEAIVDNWLWFFIVDMLLEELKKDGDIALVEVVYSEEGEENAVVLFKIINIKINITQRKR